MSKNNLLIIIILLAGIAYKLLMTWDGNFLFNMDNARDMVDVREMVILQKLRLTGPTSAIEGFYNGPLWYYFLAIPFIITVGDPYGSIVAEIILWAIGGFFLLKIVGRWGRLLVIPIGALWIASDYIDLTTLYAFNPNPIALLTPVFIYFLYNYIKSNRLIFSASAFFLGGAFFNFEMNFGIFIPVIILLSVLVINKKLLTGKNFWIGCLFFILFLLPQIFFDLKHNFFMTNSLIAYLMSDERQNLGLAFRFKSLALSFFNVFSATTMNHKTFSSLLLLVFVPIIIKIIKNKQKEIVGLICLTYIFVPFILYLFLPVNINAWHLGGVVTSSIILTAFLLKQLWDLNFAGKIISIFLSFFLLYFCFSNIFIFLPKYKLQRSMDVSLYKNEITAIDYVYKYAGGKNFKVYTYLPSVYDYPYQYLFWWYGKKQYGYIPGEYAYSPGKPQYISQKEKFEGSKDNFSGLVFLIKEPDRIAYREAWENDFVEMEFISRQMVGPLEIEIRQEKL